MRDYILCDFLDVRLPEKAYLWSHEWVSGHLGLGAGTGLSINVHEGSCWGDGDVLKLDRDDVCTTW